MKVLVTGGAGFIGSHLCDRLLTEGHDVIAVDDLSLGRLENLDQAGSFSAFRFMQMDILNKQEAAHLFKKENFEIVFHLAANSDIQQGEREIDRDLKLTFLTTFNVLDCMRLFDVKNIIFASSSAVYGDSRRIIKEDHCSYQPISYYGAAKLSSEAYISAFVHHYGMNAWIFRFPNIVGERATHGILYDFIARLRDNPKELEILGDGTQKKPYMYVKDLIDAMIFGWGHLDGSLNRVNIGVIDLTSVKAIAKIVTEEMGLSNVRYRFSGGKRGWKGDVPSYQYDTAQMESLGWKTPGSSEEALRLAVRRMLDK